MLLDSCLILSLRKFRWGASIGVMRLDELRTLLARHARPDMTTAIDGVLISKVEQPTPPSASMTGTVLALIAQGAKRIALGDRVYEYRAGQYLVASVDLPVTGHFIEASREQPALGFGLILRPATVAELLLQAGPGDLPPAGGGAPSASPSATPPTSCSTRWSGCCACSTSHATSRCWPR